MESRARRASRRVDCDPDPVELQVCSVQSNEVNMTRLLFLAIAAVQPVSALAQEPSPATSSIQLLPVAGALRSVCAASPAPDDPFLVEVARARDLDDPEAVEAALVALEPEARRMAAEAPDDAAAQYRIAAVMGAGLDLEDGLSKVSGASELHDQVKLVLTLDPEHAGASYMLGKMHASVLRLSGFKRFMAKTLLGGEMMKDASWEEARARLELATRKEPCVPEHHFELARAYAAQGHKEGWERELASVMELTEGGTTSREAKLRQRSEGFAREWRQPGQ
jgi:hypothetical protein